MQERRGGDRRSAVELDQGLAEVADGLIGALLVLDEREAHEALPTGAEADAR